MASNRKKTMVTIIAAAMAAAMVIGGGSFAYLQSQSNTVTNNFKTNTVFVELDEPVYIENNGEYNIIPGTSEKKDPFAKIDNAVDAYLFVTITDNTQNLVNFAVDDGWTALEGEDGVYYREVAADAEVKQFPILKDNKVSYDAALENDDMKDKENVKLSFEAFAIQKAGFDTPAGAFHQIPTTAVTTADDLKNALDNYNNSDSDEPFELNLGGSDPDKPISFDNEGLEVKENKNVIIDLAGRDLIVNDTNVDSFTVMDGGTLTIKNSGTTGKLYINSKGYSNDGIFLTNETSVTVSTLNFENVEVVIESNNNTAIRAVASDGESVINLNEGTVINVTGETTQSVTGILAHGGAVVNMNDGATINVTATGEKDYLDAVGIVLMTGNEKPAVLNISGGTINVVGGGVMSQGIQTGDGYQLPGNIVRMTGGTINVSGKDASAFGIANKADIEVTGGSINVDVDEGCKGYAFLFQYDNPSYGVVKVNDGIVKLTGENDYLTNAVDRVEIVTQ